ncbi:MAG: hypothetical protein L0H74_11295, partial [Brachybacterium sp.]|nr:hypothetical protein [Brachybacterium sp.]
MTFTDDLATPQLTRGNGKQLGHLVDAGTLAWPTNLVTAAEDTRWELFTAAEGGLAVTDGEVVGGQSLGEPTLREG